jgi:hypothetical protein
MSALYGTISSSAAKTKAQRGHSWLTATVSSWNKGIRVEAEVNDAGHERFKIYQTDGSGGGGTNTLLLEVV